MDVDTGTLVIGASAAGLSTAAHLQRAGLPFEILEASEVVGTTWRHHYDRLHLHTPKSISGLPGLAMPNEWPRYPGRDQVVDYLQQYREYHGLHPHYGQRVQRLVRDGAGGSRRPQTGNGGRGRSSSPPAPPGSRFDRHGLG